MVTRLLSLMSLQSIFFSQVDEECNRYVLFDEIVDHRTDGSEIKNDDAFILSPNGDRRRKESTKGWELLLRWKDGSTLGNS